MSCKLRYGIPIVVHIICKAGHLAAHIHAGNQLHSEKAEVFSNSYKIPYEYLDYQTKPGLGDLEKRLTLGLSGDAVMSPVTSSFALPYACSGHGREFFYFYFFPIIAYSERRNKVPVQSSDY